MKNNKAPGNNEIRPEMLKYGGEELVQEIHEEAVLCPILKKGDNTKCENYRAIALLDVTYKILTTCINRRLKQHMQGAVGEYQAGYRKHRSTVDQIFMLKELFIDFKKAYDTINRKELVTAIQELEIPNKMIRLLE